MDNAKHGVIFLSWGSNIKSSSMPPEKAQAILKAFGRFPHQIIWKWENEAEMNDIKPKNVYISKWLPQRDILCKLLLWHSVIWHDMMIL